MTIYNDNIARPYVYLITYKDTDEYYFGYREANANPKHKLIPASLDIGIGYFTSSDKIQKRGLENATIEILNEFVEKDVSGTQKCPGDVAFDHEQELIWQHWGDPLCLNENVRLLNGEKRFKAKTGEENCNFGKTYEEIFGGEKAMSIKKKQSDSHAGEKAAFFGRHHTEETKEIYRQRIKGKTLVEVYGEEKAKEMISKQIKAQTGTKRSDETKKKMSTASKGVPKSEAHKAALKGCQSGRKDTETSKKKKSEAHMGMYKGMSYEERFGKEKAAEIKAKQAIKRATWRNKKP